MLKEQIILKKVEKLLQTLDQIRAELEEANRLKRVELRRKESEN